MSQRSRSAMTLTVLTIVGVVASTSVLVGGLSSSRGALVLPAVDLPPGCSRPVGGFLVVMSKYGYNDSVLEGAGPSKAWPVITVPQGTVVNITVCNADPTEAHGFQVSHYYDSKIVAVAPGQVISISFVADKAGTFQIYCQIWCAIHLFMQYGQLRVTPAGAP